VNRRAPDRRWRRRFAFAPALVCLFAGCADCRFLSHKCPQPPDPTEAAETPAPDAAYRVGCPDVLEVSFADFPGWDALASVDLDGRLPLQSPGKLRAEGRTLKDIRDELARTAGVAPDRVEVRLAAPRSSRVYVHGPIRGRTRVIPYQGPEPVIDFLARVGGLPPGSKLNQVYIVRPNVAAGEKPQVFRVDVPAVLSDNNPTTNIPIKPSDEVYVGETSRSVFARVLPDWLGPAYRRLIGLLPDDWWPFSKARRP
jgi:polysaccharide export outer membrane protein